MYSCRFTNTRHQEWPSQGSASSGWWITPMNVAV